MLLTLLPLVDAWKEALYGVAAISSDDAWAVGAYLTDTSLAVTLALHWDGVQWTWIPSPSPGGFDTFYDVTAISSNDVWAVGSYSTRGVGGLTLTEHWD